MITTGSASDIVKGYGGNGRHQRWRRQGRRSNSPAIDSDYTLTKNGDGSGRCPTVAGNSPDGTDTLRNVELVDFAEREEAADPGTGRRTAEVRPDLH